MMKTLIIYNSQHGKTKKYADSITSAIKPVAEVTKTISIEEFKNEDLQGVDHLVLGSWTKGLFFFAQQPDKEWKEFAKKLNGLDNRKVSLFTTYGIATGGMFKKMAKEIGKKPSEIEIRLKSKTGILSQNDLKALQKAFN